MTIPFVVLAAIVAMGWRLRALENRNAPASYRKGDDGFGAALLIALLFIAVALAFHYQGPWR